MSQYYTNLRQENAPHSDMTHVYRAPHHHQLRGITPQELQGLVSVLQLTQRIASQVRFYLCTILAFGYHLYDLCNVGLCLQYDVARLELCDDQHLLPLVVLVGLVGCAVPTILKAQIFKTLAAFAKSPEIAATLWQSIEVSQV